MTNKHLFSQPKTSVISVAKNLCNLWLIFRAFLWLKNPFNLRNPWLINYLHAFGIFTLVKKSLQIRLFMQNEPNFRKSQMNVNKVLTNAYEEKTLGEHGKNEPNTNPNEPNQSQFQKCSNECKSFVNKDL